MNLRCLAKRGREQKVGLVLVSSETWRVFWQPERSLGGVLIAATEKLRSGGES